MNFLEQIFERLGRAPGRPVLQEVRDGRLIPTTGSELLSLIRAARGFLRRAGLQKGDRCAVLAHNSVRWAALDLALMAEGILVVPLYARQAPAELVGIMKDCGPSLLCCGDAALRDAIHGQWPEAPPACLFDQVFAPAAASATSENAAPAALPPVALQNDDPVTIIYTSGTSGEPKGVVLNVANLNHMLPSTTARLDLLMGPREQPDRVFHYLPFCFAGSWILLLTCLSRNSVLTLSTDLTRLMEELKLASPDYFLNVPALLERMRARIEEQLGERGGVALSIYRKAQAGRGWWRALARASVFPAIRKKIGPNLKALICGSAPLAKETQLFFTLLGLPVLQVYGLTETTAICTMDHPQRVEPGRVGPAIPGIEMKLDQDDQVLVRGPNIFPGYWNRPAETARAIRNGWFHTGDQGEQDGEGNWRVIGRLKDLIILNSGHKIAPEPIEETLVRSLPGAQQVVLTGNGRSFLSAILTGDLAHDRVEATLESVNAQLPHYQRIHAFHLRKEPFTIENGLLTANGKLKREAIAARLHAEIGALYGKKEA